MEIESKSIFFCRWELWDTKILGEGALDWFCTFSVKKSKFWKKWKHFLWMGLMSYKSLICLFRLCFHVDIGFWSSGTCGVLVDFGGAVTKLTLRRMEDYCTNVDLVSLKK